MTAGKKLGLLALSLVLAIALAAGVFLWSLWQVPDFYERAMSDSPDPQARKKAAKTFVERTVRLAQEIEHSDHWEQEFTQGQVNAWLAEELHQKYADQVPPGVRDPRVEFAEGSVLVGFRYRYEGWEGVVSLQLKPWVPEPNRVAVAVESIRAGLLPIPRETIFSEVSRAIDAAGWRAEWTHRDGRDVLLVHLDRGASDDPVLEAVQVLDGAFRLSGRRADFDGRPTPGGGGETFRISRAP